jgi:putative NADPH-quinone reductase
VLAYGWAYGSKGKALHGKELLLAVSVGAGEDAYQAGGSNHFSLSELHVFKSGGALYQYSGN